MKHRGTLILAVIGLGLALSASIPFIASQAAPADVVQADSLPVGVSADGLELWLQLDDAPGTVSIADASGNAHTTDCTGDACPTVGVSGMFTTALRFDGVNDYLESDDFDLDDDFSISLWVSPSTTDDYQVFIGKHTSDGDNLMLFGFYNGGYYFRIRDTIYQGGTKTTGWQHLAVTGRYSDTSETAVTMFKNGQVLWQQTLNAVVGDISGGKGWSLGQDWDSSTSKTDFYGGDMDEVMVFSRTLAMTEVVALYQSAPLYPQSLHPAANAIGAALSTDISVTYGHSISPSSVTSRTFAVHGMQSGLLTGAYAVSGGAVTLIPDRPLHAGELVRASACDGILSEAGTPALPVQWQFNAGVVQERCVGVFADISAGLPGVNVGSASWGDYDNDGDLDILLTGWTDSAPYDFIARVYRNDDGVFADISAGLPGVAFGSASWGDYDNDGDLDILLTGWTGSDPDLIARVYRNDDGVFSNITAGLPGVEVGSASWGDYDNDGDLDILLTGSDPARIARVYRNDDGVFADISAGLPGVSDSSATWGDYDNDGDLDILLTGRTGSDPDRIARVYRNDDGVFADISAGLPGVSDSSASWGDYDNDGDLDILLTGRTGSDPDRIARVYRNDDGVFADISAGLPGVAFGSASWGDYDNDGDLDILLTGGTGSDPARIARVYRNDDGVFSNITAGLPGVDSSAAWGDYDNDGDLDILLTGYTGSDPDRIARVYRNDDCADLAVSKRVVVPTGAGEAVTAAPGEPLTYTLAFANLGEAPAEGVVLTDSLPLGEVTGLGYTVSSGLSVILRAGTTYIWDVEDLPVGEGGTITITGVIKNPLPFGLVFTNTATIYTSSEDGDPENNHSAVTVTIQSQEDLVFLPLLQR